MTDRPIIFSAPMVRALLAGRKTQTRRLLKRTQGQAIDRGFDAGSLRLAYAPGDRLYVREAHALVPATAYRMSEGVSYAVNSDDPDRACVYREGWDRSTGGLRWRPSIHMPRWASRLTLTVTEVRVQRLQEISNEDAKEEGCPGFYSPMHPDHGCTDGQEPWEEFQTLWNCLHGPDAWDANPWVVAVSFTVQRGNIDRIGGDK